MADVHVVVVLEVVRLPVDVGQAGAQSVVPLQLGVDTLETVRDQLLFFQISATRAGYRRALFHAAGRLGVEEELEALGYDGISEHLLGSRYDGVSDLVSSSPPEHRPTWWTRFFDYL
ncbi:MULTISPECIES: hypothetical protein [Streptomyces]|uniref:Uncharacterized protein n=2 Tax=Streptomyces TaxID=1883 RepID=A0ABU4JZK4_9ACTN|nr:hypothetical protein [Streptomyces roseolus]MDX2290911.1 hypothetical protein [Streptomyces roseolus]